MPKGKWISYSHEEQAWLEANRLLPISEYHAGFVAAFARDDVTSVNLHSRRKRLGWSTGRTGHFEKGTVPHNRGKKCAPGTGGRHPNAQRTQFKRGQRSGVAVKLYKPVGTERISKDGYRERKIHDGMPLKSRWRAIHLVEWEAAHGPLPEGYALKCLGDKANTDPTNWEAVPRALLPRLAGGNQYRRKLAFDDAPDELKPAVLAVAKLEHAARERRKARAA
ncbi:HNH endonuclease [Novosphingobium sp. BL-8H]|uniref:HNH endonuclease n=1 Tax=Novosphingobium sp. BL-8H TaxID=3127640 RepID=UPI0037563397